MCSGWAGSFDLISTWGILGVIQKRGNAAGELGQERKGSVIHSGHAEWSSHESESDGSAMMREKSNAAARDLARNPLAERIEMLTLTPMPSLV